MEAGNYGGKCTEPGTIWPVNTATYNPWDITGLVVFFSGTCQKLTGSGAEEKGEGHSFFLAFKREGNEKYDTTERARFTRN